MSNYGISPHIAVPKAGEVGAYVYFKPTARIGTTHATTKYNRRPNASYNPSKAHQEWRQVRGPFKAAMAEEIKGQQAASVLKTMLIEKAAAEALANMKEGKGGRRRKQTRRKRTHRRRRVSRRF